MAKQPLIWLNRPREDSISFAADLTKAGLNTIVAPVLHIVHQPLRALPNMPNALLLTSRHATHALAQLPAAWRTLPTYCVGNATALAAREHGCARLIPGKANVLGLVPHIISNLPAGSNLLYLAGEEVSTDITHLLTAYSIKVHTHVVYRAMAEHVLTEEIQHALADRRITAAAFFSPRSAETAAHLLTQAGLADRVDTIEAFCLSARVAVAAAQLPWAALHTCRTPNKYAMHDLLVSQLLKAL